MEVQHLPLEEAQYCRFRQVHRNRTDEEAYEKAKEQLKFLKWAFQLLNEPFLFFELPSRIISKLNDICRVYISVGMVPDTFDDAIEEIEEYFEQHVDIPYLSKGIFVKCNHVSPKDSPYYEQCPPLFNKKDLVKVLMTSARVNVSLLTDPILIVRPYNLTWRKNKFNELRCFVYAQKLTAISQYYWSVYAKLDFLSEEEWQRIIDKINALVEKVCTNFSHLKDFVLDVVFYDENVDLIELNTFGVDKKAGSACFDWVEDRNILYGNGSKVVIRVVTE